ncbi:hypothetical protein PANT111_190162 [Pantoea brenneri]|uniref:Uncharacterized protein n=1 Tax=Pantoea brenneri TaxID=472694 RepID=A0AAX3J6D8_9GAMM|nr:hypothetical protein PANT111_190162 [Pantoea brenneri]
MSGGLVKDANYIARLSVNSGAPLINHWTGNRTGAGWREEWIVLAGEENSEKSAKRHHCHRLAPVT